MIGEIGEEDINHNVVKSTCRLDVYGAVRQSSGASESSHKFVGALGHTSESSTDLIYMRARYYDPSIGRFISEDPAQDGTNWYVYCESNPVNNIDPDGRMVGPVIAALVLLAALAVVLFMDFYYVFVGPDEDPRNYNDETNGFPRTNRLQRRHGVPPPGYGPTVTPKGGGRASNLIEPISCLVDIRNEYYELGLIM